MEPICTPEHTRKHGGYPESGFGETPVLPQNDPHRHPNTDRIARFFHRFCHSFVGSIAVWWWINGINFSSSLFILVNLSIGTAIALLMNVIAIKHRDYYQALPYLLNFGIWITPVFIRVHHSRKLPVLLYFNPMAGVIQGYRWCLLNEGQFDIGFYLFI